MSIGMWTVADLYESDGQTIIPFTTWLKRGAVERDRLVWLGIINVIKHIQLNFCKSKMIKAGIYVNDKFIEVYNITQRDVTKLLSSKKYSKLKEVDFKFKAKANSIHGKINDDTWERLFLSIQRVNLDNKTKELQYKILMRYVGTNYILYKMKKINSQTCSFCMIEPETIEHLFFNCVIVKNLWIEIFNKWNIITNCIVVPSLKSCILGEFNLNPLTDNTYMSLYALSLIVKSYIMKCKYEHTELCYIGSHRMLKYRVGLLQKVDKKEVIDILSQMCIQ